MAKARDRIWAMQNLNAYLTKESEVDFSASISGAKFNAYVLASIADEHKRQRDLLFDALQRLMKSPSTLVGHSAFPDDDAWGEANSAMAACEEKPDG